MRKLIYPMMVSLDGYIESPNGDIEWVIVDEELHTYINDQQRQRGGYLDGRRTYELMCEFWPTADSDPTQPEYIRDFSRIWKGMPKYVFSRTLDKVEGDAQLVRENAVDVVTRLKEQPGKDLELGGASFASTFIRLGLIDEYWLYMEPIILGGGKPMFPALLNPVNLQLVETRAFGSGVVLLRYRQKEK